jgi:hypothetical protein
MRAGLPNAPPCRGLDVTERTPGLARFGFLVFGAVLGVAGRALERGRARA